MSDTTYFARDHASRRLLALAAALTPLLGCGDEAVPSADPCARAPDDISTPPIHTPRWAFEPWISKDISSTDDTRDFVAGFRSRDIPVGVVVLDSPWETNYNTLVPNPSRYPGFEGLLDELHGQGIRLVLWTTQMVNSSSLDLEPGGDLYAGPSPNFEQGLACGYFVDDGTTYGWWKGVGAGVDFFQPSAVAWWHRQQDPLLDMGIDGFKLDFGDSYVRSDPVKTARGEVPHQAYSERYYEDFFAYGVSRRGPEDFVTMVRPWDASYDFAGRFFARREHAPVAWVGDNRRDWVGLADALESIFRSAAAGYVVLGSDIGGYLDRDDKHLTTEIPFDPDVFARWTAVGALSPFMELHGRANLAPWTVPEDAEHITPAYRYWATLHHELVPFFYSLAQRAYAGGDPIVRPQGAPADWKGDFRYMLGDALLVAPILSGTGRRDVALPPGARWYDWWDAAQDPHEGGTIALEYDATDRSRLPLFVREGAIVPMNAAGDATGFGTASSNGDLTVLVYPGAKSTFELTDVDDAITSISAESTATDRRVTISRCVRPTRVRVRTDAPPSLVVVDGMPLPIRRSQAALDASATGWLYDDGARAAWIKLEASVGERRVVLDR